jgi:hypothetical protein
MVCRKKSTMFLDAKEDTPISEVKKMVAGKEIVISVLS